MGSLTYEDLEKLNLSQRSKEKIMFEFFGEWLLVLLYNYLSDKNF